MMTANEAMSVLAAVGATHITEGRMSSDLVYWSRGVVGSKAVRIHDHEWGSVVVVGDVVSIIPQSEPGSVEREIDRMLEVA